MKRVGWRKKPLFLLLVITLSVPSLLFAQSADPLSSASGLKALLFPFRPAKNSRVEEFFQNTLTSEKQTAAFETIIESDEKLAKAAQKGRDFRQDYFRELEKDFGKLNSGFFLAPEKTILNWIALVAPEKSTAFAQRIPETLAARRAWEDTLSRFALPGDMTAAELEKVGQTNLSYRNAASFYRKRFYLHQDDEETKERPEVADLPAIRNALKEKIKELRLANYRGALFRASEEKALFHPRLRSLTSGKKVSLKSLGQLRIFLVSPQVPATEIPVKRDFVSEAIPSLILFRLLNFDYPTAAKLREMTPYHNLGQEKVWIDAPGARPFVLSEGSFNFFLRQLRVMDHSFEDPKNGARVYLGEAAARDFILARMVQLIDEDTDGLEQLKGRLLAHERLAKNLMPSHTSSLTARAQVSESLSTKASALNALRWSGYRKDPNFWWARDSRASAKVRAQVTVKWKRSVPDVTPSVEVKLAEKPKEAAPKITAKGQLGWGKYVRRAALWSTLTFAGVYTAIAIADDYFSGSNSESRWHSHKPSEKKPESLDNVMPNQPETMSAKGMKEAASVVAFKLTDIKINHSEIPTYFNYPSYNYEYGAKDKLAIGVDVSPAAGELIDLSRPAPSQEKDFTVENKLPQFVDGHYIPLVTPSGFRLTELSLTTKKALLVYGLDYLVYQDPNDGLLFAKTRDSIGTVLYRASFKKDDRFRHDNLLFQSVDRVGLSRMIMALKASNATQLGNALDELDRTNFTISYQQVADVVTRTGVYTFDSPPVSWGLRSESGNYVEASTVFKNYLPLLRDGVFYYQCTGSNLFLRDFLVDVINATRMTNEEGPLRVENVTGYVYQGGDSIMAVGHLHTLLVRLDMPHAFRELDGTPSHMDPKYEAWMHPLSGSNRSKDQDDRDSQRGNKQPLLPAKLEEVTEEDGLNEKTEVGTRPDPKMLSGRLQVLKQKQKAALELLQTIAPQYPALLDLTRAYRTPGALLLSVARVVTEYVEDRATKRETLERVTALDLGYSPYGILKPSHRQRLNQAMELNGTKSADVVIESLLQKFRSDLENQIGLERTRELKEESHFDYLRREDFRLVFFELAQVLASNSWASFSEIEKVKVLGHLENCAEQLAF